VIRVCRIELAVSEVEVVVEQRGARARRDRRAEQRAHVVHPTRALFRARQTPPLLPSRDLSFDEAHRFAEIAEIAEIARFRIEQVELRDRVDEREADT
jgi:hypothetical protein